jgi:hypothetical protein
MREGEEEEGRKEREKSLMQAVNGDSLLTVRVPQHRRMCRSLVGLEFLETWFVRREFNK